MLKKQLGRFLAGVVALSLVVVEPSGMQNVQVRAEQSTVVKTEDMKRVSVHDPSIFKDPKTETYYVFGSHMATATSTDLVNWEQVSTDYQYAVSGNDPIYGNVKENFADSFKWAGYDDGDCSGGNFAVWAPDVIYNDQYVWPDKSTGAYMMYYTASSTWRRSCIGVAVTKSLNEPFQAVDTLVYSGMTMTGDFDGNSKRNTKWDNEYLNFKELIDNGVIDGVNPKWFMNDGKEYNIGYAPNCIDPGIVQTPDGKIWMSYGSWSAGIFMLEIDPKTGLAKYPGEDSGDPATGVYTDRYYGIHIAGGNPTRQNIVSGEAPYIRYDAKTGYYYLYITYGGLTTTGGYSMRLFRSKNVTGPYEDASGKKAYESFKDVANYGVKLIGNYGFTGQEEQYFAAGHNSALADNGKYYLFSHQRFNDGTEYHEVRVRQQFLNEDDWLVTAVYENKNEEIKPCVSSNVVGNYEIINHGLGEKDGTLLENQMVTLVEDGTVIDSYSNEMLGTWSLKNNNDNTYTYVTINMGDVVYKGVFFQQMNDNDVPTMTFSTIGNNNESLWGSKLELSDDLCIQIAQDALKQKMPKRLNEDFEPVSEIKGTTVTWKSENPAVLTDTGKVTRGEQDVVVNMKATITKGETSRDFTYPVTVNAKAKVIYGFDFENNKGTDTLVANKGSVKSGTATLKGTAKLVKDETRGNVLEIVSPSEVYNENYLKLPEDTLSTVTGKGYTVAMWVNAGADIFEHSALFNAMKNGTYPMTRIGVNLCERINANGFIDGGYFNWILRGTGWHQVVYSINETGSAVWIDGEYFNSSAKDLASCFDTTNAASIQKADDVRIGSGSPWVDRDIENARFDNVEVYDGTLTASEVKALYNATKDGNSGESGTNNGSGSDNGSGSSNPSTTTPSTGNTEKPSSSAGEPVVETKTEQNAAGNEVEVTTTTNKDKDGNVISIVEKSEIKGIAANTTVTVTVEKLADGTTKSATADMVTQAAGQKTSISKEVVAQMKEAAGDADVAITLTATNSAGKELYTVTVDTDLITAGNSLYIYKLDADGNYVMVNSKTYKVGKDGSLALSIKNKSDYVLVSKAEATKIEKEIKNTVKVKKSSQTVKRGKTVKVTMSNSLNMNNVKSITYTSTKNSVAKVSKSGKVTAKKAGSATIKAKVTLKNGSTKTVTMKVKVK